MDALSEILASFGVSGTIFSQATFGTPWGVRGDPMPSGVFHVVVSGSAFVRVDGEPDGRQLSTGDIIVLPHGHGHAICGHADTHPVPIRSLPSTRHASGIMKLDYPGQAGGDGRGSCQLLCGTIRFADAHGNPLVRLLPALIHMPSASLEVASWIDTTVRMLAAEVNQAMPGAEVMLTKLAEMLFVQVLRAHISGLDEAEAPTGWIAGLEDARIAHALALLHQSPGARWTGGELAARVGMSRSSLFARFTELVGEPPTQYLTHWRMHLAKLELEKGELGLAQLADRVGYASEGAFSKAFKRVVGVSPSEYRLAAGPSAAAG